MYGYNKALQHLADLEGQEQILRKVMDVVVVSCD
jgi:hypothetical protein